MHEFDYLPESVQQEVARFSRVYSVPQDALAAFVVRCLRLEHPEEWEIDRRPLREQLADVEQRIERYKQAQAETASAKQKQVYDAPISHLMAQAQHLQRLVAQGKE